MANKFLCPYCGNNQIPHLLYWYHESLNIMLQPVRGHVLYNPITKFLIWSGLADKAENALLCVAEAARIVTRQTDMAKCKVRRAQVLWEEAERRGIKMSELLLFGRPFDVYVSERPENRKIGKSEGKIIFSGLPRPEGYSNAVLDIMDDKWLFKKMMIEKGLPVPQGGCATTFRQARKIFQQIKKPVVVKPRAGSRGRHGTINIADENQLRQAFKVAKQLCYWVMVEEQLTGPVYRGTVINFKLEGVLRGDPPQVVGDGSSNITELVTQKNLKRLSTVKNIALDSHTDKFLASQNLLVASVPAPGEVINLSEKIGIGYGGSSREDFEICHPDNKELLVQAAKVLNDPLVGFDFIIPDIAISWKQQHCGFIEVNSLPFINLHHDPLLGQSRNIAAAVWNMLGW